MSIRQNQILWIGFTSLSNAIQKLILFRFIFLSLSVGKTCVTHVKSFVIILLSNWMDWHTEERYLYNSAKLSFPFMKMSFLPTNITFLNFIFELQTISHHYHYDHGSILNNTSKMYNTFYNNQNCLEKW